MSLTGRRTRMWKNMGRILTNSTRIASIVGKIAGVFLKELIARKVGVLLFGVFCNMSGSDCYQENTFPFARFSDPYSAKGREGQRNTLVLLIRQLIPCSFVG